MNQKRYWISHCVDLILNNVIEYHFLNNLFKQVAVPNLFYGKTLIELAQMGENKVLALPDQEEEDDDEEGGDEEGEDEEEEAGGTCTSTSAEATVAPKESTNESNNGAGPSNAGASSSSSSEPQPGTSSSSCNGNNGNTDNGNEEANENLQFAWEALEMAAKIFRRLGVGYEEYLAETHYGLGEILMENQNCAEACRDYSKHIVNYCFFVIFLIVFNVSISFFTDIAFELFNKVEPVKERHLAEIKYKTGLCHYAAANYDASIADLQKSADYMQKAIEAQKKLEQTPAVQQLIDDLTKTREDIIVKMADVQETKQLVNWN